MGSWSSSDGAWLGVQNVDRFSVYRRAFGNRFFIAAFSLVLILIAMNWLADRLNAELERAESAQFHLRLAELHSAVTLMQASFVAKGDLEGLENFAGANPMDWIEEEAAYYMGELSFSEAKLTAGNWAFDPALGEIGYLPKNISTSRLLLEINDKAAVQPALGKNNRDWLRFKVVALFSRDRQILGPDKVTGLELRLLNND
jgi:hypothetical protein